MPSKITASLKNDLAAPDQPGGMGTLHGIGVGPGDPELLTLRAVRLLNSVDLIFAAASPKNNDSLALAIAQPHLRPGVDIVRLDFPMTHDKSLLRAAWEKNAQSVLSVLNAGKNAAFLTLGDPMIYSTFGYLMRELLRREPKLNIIITPGITSYQDAAAKSQTVLCQSDENLLIVSGINGKNQLEAALKGANSAVILKSYKNIRDIAATVEHVGRRGEAVFASRLGLEDEHIAKGPDAIPDKAPYLSLLLLPPRREDEDISHNITE